MNKPIITTIFHPLREALQLSVLEYVILDEVRQLSTTNPQFPYCLKSKEKIAEQYGVSLKTIQRYFQKFVDLKYLEKNNQGKYRTTTAFNNLYVNRDDCYLAYRNDDFSFVSGKTVGLGQNVPTIGSKCPSDWVKMSQRLGQNVPLDIHRDIHKDIHRSTSGENEKSFSSLEGNLTKITPPSSARPPSDAQKYASEVEKVFQGYESHFKTKLRVRSDSRKSKVKKILKHFSIEEVLKSIEYYSKDSWYTGQNDRNWKVDIDYIIRKPEHIEKGLALKPKQSNPYW